MSIHHTVEELYGINSEILSLAKRMKELRAIKVKLEKEITEYIVKHNTESLTFKGTSIVLRDHKNVPRKSKNERVQQLQTLLSKYGVRDPARAAGEIIVAQKGDPTITKKVKIVSTSK